VTTSASDRAKRKPGKVRQAVFALIIIAAITVIIEIVLRLVAPIPRFHDPRFVSNLELDYPEFIIKDHDLFWKFRANQRIASNFFVEGTYTINSRGLRTPEFAVPKPPGITRVVCLGNSCTFGYGVPDEVIYARQLEELLRQDAPQSQWEVVCAGVTGYASLQGMRFARRHLAEWQPDVVTICYGWNDHWIAAGGVADRDQELPAQWKLALQNQLTHSRSYRWLKYLIFKIMASGGDDQPVQPVLRVSPDDYTTNIANLVAYCRELGARVIVLTAPIADQNPHPVLARGHQAYITSTRQIAAQLQTELVDAASAFEGHPEFYDNSMADYIHYNAAGHRLVAQLLGETILRGSK